jgi:altronate hydrolase
MNTSNPPEGQTATFSGWPRLDGRKGIRNVLVVAYLVECAHHVAREIALPFREQGVHLIGFGGCFPNAYADRMMRALCTHPNVGGALLVSLGCESFNRNGLAEHIRATSRPVKTLVIQKSGGTQASIATGQRWVEEALSQLAEQAKVGMHVNELVVGTICGGSDATSGMTANPAVGEAFDRLEAAGATTIFEETGELIGCEDFLSTRAARPELKRLLAVSIDKAARHYAELGHGSFAPGNADGGLTTIEEKSLGAYSKSGHALIQGLLKPTDLPPRPGLYLLDVVPDGPTRHGFANINDNAEIAELMACGAHLTLFTTGRGSVVGSAISPVIKICANPSTFARMPDDMDVNAGRILDGEATLAEVGEEIYQRVLATAAGKSTASERLGHQEFVLTYKTSTPAGPGCLPGG